MSDDLPKLVRDRIPKIIEEDNEESSTQKVSDSEVEKWLRMKVVEEAKEFEEDGEIEELADLYAVIQRYLEIKGISESDLEGLEREKSDKRGGFQDNIILEEIIDE